MSKPRRLKGIQVVRPRGHGVIPAVSDDTEDPVGSISITLGDDERDAAIDAASTSIPGDLVVESKKSPVSADLILRARVNVPFRQRGFKINAALDVAYHAALQAVAAKRRIR